MKYSVCITTPEVRADIPFALLSGDFEQKVSKAASFGYDGVELMVTDPSRLDAGYLKRVIAAGGLEVSAISTGAMVMDTGLSLLAADAGIRAKAENRLHELMLLAGSLGAPVVTIGSFRGKAASVGGVSKAAGLLKGILQKAAATAEIYSLFLAVEPINRKDMDFLGTRVELEAFLGSAMVFRVGLLLDTYHADMEEPDCVDSFRLAAGSGLLRHVHISGQNRLPPGPGAIDFRAIVSVLAKASYTGYLSAELRAGVDPDGAAKATIEYMRSVDSL